LKPDQFHDPRFVAQTTNKTLGSALSQGFESAENAAELHRFALLVYVPSAVKLGAIHVAKWEMKQKISAGKNTQLRLECVSTMRAHTFQKLYVGIKVGQNIRWFFFEKLK
jgi:hypothetical protein